MITAIAHAQTEFNKPNPDRVLGWSDVPLSPEGHANAEKFAAQIAKIRGQHREVLSSDLQRATQTAAPIAKQLGVGVKPMPELRPWRLGQFQGQLSDQVDQQIDQLKKAGNASVPGGESHNEFLARFLPTAKSLIESPEHHLVVTHSRNLDVLRSLAAGKGKGLVEAKEKGDETNPLDTLTIDPSYNVVGETRNGGDRENE